MREGRVFSWGRRLAAIIVALACAGAHGASTDIATSPMVTSENNATAVKPNLMFILDDSGSMNWDFLPDWANDYYCKKSDGTVGTTNSGSACCRNRSGSSDACMWMSGSATTFGTMRGDVPFMTGDFNRIYYNPAIRYVPPVNADGTSKDSQTSANTSAWTSVKLDAYGIQHASTKVVDLVSGYPDGEWCTDTTYATCFRNTSNYLLPNSSYASFHAISGNAYYYVIVPGEFCDSDKQTNCTVASAATGTYTVPAKVRWCSDTALTTCQALKNNTYQYPRYPMIFKSGDTSNFISFSVSGSSTASSNKTASVTGISVTTGAALLSTATTASNDVDTVAQAIITNLTNGYMATAKRCATSGGTRTCTFLIYAPYAATAANGSVTPAVTNGVAGTTTMTIAGSGSFNGKKPVPGSFQRVDIVSTNDSYPYPGSATKASARSDCAGTTCTYAEEMTNFANWYTYYRTRMQMMKSATSLAFQGVSDNFRVGYLSIDANASNSFLNVATFDSGQKSSWYTKLFAADPSNGTPLRSALSTAGLIYGGSLNGVSLNGSTVVDPVQYSCQKNFTILSTDGYWNTGNDSGCSGRSGQGCRLDRTTAIGNSDGGAGRPYSDGATATVTAVTPYTTVVRQQSVQSATQTSTWTRTVVTQGGSCAISVPAAAGSCYQDNGKNSANAVRTWCMEANTSNGTNCTAGAGSSPKAYACRGTSNATNTPGGVDLGCVTDGAGVQWCLYPNNTTTGTSSCTAVYSGNSLYVCRRGTTSSNTGTTVTTTTQTYNQVAVGSLTIITDQTSTYNNTLVTTNGVVTSNTNSTPATSTATVSNTLSATSDTGAPDAGTSWTTASSASTCMATPTAAGTSTAAITAANTTTSGTATVTTLSTTGPTAGTTATTVATSGGVSDTLADVANYYYATDLRAAGSMNNGVDVGTGDYDSANGIYTNNIQRMTTYTLGLGIDGYMKFQSNYSSASSGDYRDVASGATASSTTCTWQSAGTTCNWPTPSSDSQANVDDLWHAAVNGRGQYFSAGDPAALAAGLSGALASISAKLGDAAAATTSNPNITTGDNFLFSSDFKTSEWTSELQRLQIDVATGNIITSGTPPMPVIDWNAQPLLDTKVTPTTDTRTIYTFSTETSTYPSQLKPFVWGNLTTAEQAYFSSTSMASLPQFCATTTYTIVGDPTIRNCLSASEQADAAGDKLIRFLRGQTGYEDRTENTAAGRPIYYRLRTHALGDIVSSEAVYVKQPLANYSDSGFSTFKTSQASNPGMVYVAANDGMLHAFNATTGQESWAYLPSMVLPNLYKLASMNYKNDHRFLLDGTPVVDYAYFGGSWKTLLIGGLAAGGAGFYALDITDPTQPKALWEFRQRTTSCAATLAAAVGATDDCDLGYSYGNPVVTKLADGTWVVLVTSGYNNTTPGDGGGYLYVLNPATGAIIRKIGTGVGSNSAISGVCTTAPCPSGVAKIAAWVESPDTDNTVRRVYGGDLFGNLWRFDVNDTISPSGYEALRLAVFSGPAGTPQPVTERPELGDSNGVALVLVGTGRFLGDSDRSDATQQSSPTNNKQSFYAVKDPLTATGWGAVRGGTATFIAQTVTVDSNQNRLVSQNSVNLASAAGWYIDFPDNGERSYTDPALVLGTLVFTTNQPTGTACSSAGQSFIYNLDYRSGAPISGFGGVKIGNALATRPVIVQLDGGAVRSITRLGDTTTDVRDVGIGSAATVPRRVSWRQLIE
ncbi:PilC/PilY family type IV pilus protein [uncultured Propionivibrio sp.]|uniref:PilC/PilY family type IV pilus protein n=1 Tax=uncultured Propionivibrio sp. TaxID=426737 RepID=UPI0029C023F1|nr:PilC/PilY family type IV pilus protein [uncultured Propionivibrio sp.]